MNKTKFALYIFCSLLICLLFLNYVQARNRYTIPATLQRHYNNIRRCIYHDYLRRRNYQNIRFYVSATLHDLADLEWRACEDYQTRYGRDCNSPVTRSLKNLARNLSCKENKLHTIKNIFEFVRDNIQYQEEEGNIPQFPYETLAYGMGDCEDQAVLLAALLRLAGLKSGLVRISDSSINLHHVFCIVMVDPDSTPNYEWSFGEYPHYGHCWMILDPAYTHPFGDFPQWTDHYRRRDGSYSIPDPLARAVIIDWDEYKKLCNEADSGIRQEPPGGPYPGTSSVTMKVAPKKIRVYAGQRPYITVTIINDGVVPITRLKLNVTCLGSIRLKRTTLQSGQFITHTIKLLPANKGLFGYEIKATCYEGAYSVRSVRVDGM